MTPKPSVILIVLAAALVVVFSANLAPQAQGTPDTPPRQVRSLSPGDVLDATDLEFIERPGFYGLGSDLRGSRYAIAQGHLVRVDPDSLRVQSVLRSNVRSID